MPQKECQKAFRLGLQRRKPHQLHTGVYKLIEVQDQYSGMVEDAHEIIKLKKRLILVPRLNHCTAEDMAHWLKKIPGNIAFDLGYYLIPSVIALEGNNLPHDVVISMTAHFTLQSQALLDSCQEVHDAIHDSIAWEYSLMSQGESLILPLLQRMEGLFGAALTQTASYTPAREKVGT
jgi:hypothetical protein